MTVDHIIGICIAVPFALFAIYLGGRLFGLGFATSIRQLKRKQENNHGISQ